jgi:aldehyde dehydrogenase (NAD+)
MEKNGHLIGGSWIETADDQVIEIIDPSSGEQIGFLSEGRKEDIDRAVTAARAAISGDWGNLTPVERGRLLYKLGQLISDHQEELAAIEVRDVGKPLTQARNDVIACARYCEFYSGAVDKLHGQTIPYQNGYTVLTLREPHGVTGHIIPWNYPLQIIGRSVIGALAAGNAVVIKPGEDASLSTLFFGKLTIEAGFPPGAVNIVTGYGEGAGAALAGHPGINHLSFTGSSRVGTLVQKAAADNTVQVTLELGGKSPQIIFEDANQDEALPFIVNAAIQNAGQTCSAGSRVLIHNPIYEEFVGKLMRKFESLVVGPAMDDHDIGPLISEKQKQRVESYLDRTLDLQILARGKLAASIPENGFYALPVLLGDVPQDHCLAKEEIFGPVLSLIRFGSEKEAVEIANQSRYGLVAGVWTREGARQLRVAKSLECGQVFINNYGAGGGVELPFGGVKGSGFGREKGMEALYGFTTLKTIAISHG